MVYMAESPYEILATKYMPYEDLQLLKRLENVFDQTDNSGAFTHTMAALIEHSGLAPFDFYVRLTNWWVEKGYYPQSHNAKGTAEILYAYIKEYHNEEAAELVELLRYDMFIVVPGWRPLWLNWNTEAIFETVSSFWRDEQRVRKLLPEYSFSSWRQIHKNYPIERFVFDGEEKYVMNMINEEKVVEIKLM